MSYFHFSFYLKRLKTQHEAGTKIKRHTKFEYWKMDTSCYHPTLFIYFGIWFKYICFKFKFNSLQIQFASHTHSNLFPDMDVNSATASSIFITVHNHSPNSIHNLQWTSTIIPHQQASNTHSLFYEGSTFETYSAQPGASNAARHWRPAWKTTIDLQSGQPYNWSASEGI